MPNTLLEPKNISVLLQYEYTAVLYLNDWDANMYGKTVFFEREEKEEEGSQQQSDIIGGVVSKFGRISIFRNLIPHSARPPSSTVTDARLTFPLKVSCCGNLVNRKQ